MAKQLTLKPFNGRRGKAAEAYMLPLGIYKVHSADGMLGGTVRVTEGPYGLGVTFEPYAGTPAVDVTDTDPRYASVVQYRQTEQAQAYRRWYQEQETPADVAVLGPTYQRKDGSR